MRKNQEGFTLIEVAIVVMILGLVMVPIVNFITEKRAADQRKDQSVSRERILAALESYLQLNGSYPCPADMTLKLGDPNFGSSNCSGSAPGFAVSTDWIGGALPFATLNIPYRLTYNLNGWNIKYFISTKESNTASYNGNGTFEIVNENNRIVADNVSFIIVDPGPDGKGTYNVNGVAGPSCGTGSMDSENCDNDKRFRIAYFNNTGTYTSPDYYDDNVDFKIPMENLGMWVERSAPEPSMTGLNITNRNYGYVGIGSDSPTEKLEVKGNIFVEGSSGGVGGNIFVDDELESKSVTATEKIEAVNQVTSPTFVYGN